LCGLCLGDILRWTKRSIQKTIVVIRTRIMMEEGNTNIQASSGEKTKDRTRKSIRIIVTSVIVQKTLFLN